MIFKLRLDADQLEEDPAVSSAAFLFESSSLSRVYFPSRTFLYSLCSHLVVFAAVICFSIFRNVPEPPTVVDRIFFVDLRVPDMLYLPAIAAGEDPGTPAPARKSETRAKRTEEAPAPRTKGLSYPGPQPIVSDVPNPTNKIQTVLQPDLENPPVLVPPVPLPNIVQIADLAPATPKMEPPPPPPEPEPPVEPKPAEPPPANPPETQPEPKAPEPAMVLPALELAPTVKMDAPKLIIPAASAPAPVAKPINRPKKIELPSLVKAAPLPPAPEPEPPAQPKPAEPAPKPPEPAVAQSAPNANDKAKETSAAESPSSTGDKKDLLVLSPIPASPKAPVNVPAGEARGRFAISPEPNLSPSENEPGMKTGTVSINIGIGPTNPNSSGSAPAATRSSGVSVGTDGKGTGDKNSVAGGQGNGSGRGRGSGPQAKSGSGSGSARKAFAGITIAGADIQPGDSQEYPPATKARRPLQTSYSLNIISTEDSGGGLPFFGVFSHEQIYTVYLDMRQEETEQDPFWTLEFAIILGSSPQSGNAVNPGLSRQGTILPFPAEKERPVFPVQLVRRYLGQMIIVYGIVNPEGKMEQISIKDSPDPSFNEPVTRALSKWIFRPAQLNGAPVAAKLLMGIPLWLPQ